MAGNPQDGGLFGLGEPNDAYARYFIGQSYLNGLIDNDVLGASNVTFEPGCRNNWHVHHGTGQMLLVTDGRGWYQEWGKPARELGPGDVVDIPAEVKHWHGAAKDSWFCHVAMSAKVPGASAEWLEPVDDEAYDGLEQG
jgi:quercetin dioxygenase-like cupin family protein